jgi:DNA polymerase-4
VSAFCRDCLADAADTGSRCRSCGSPRLVRHADLHRLAIAHIDCDAFYATIEKRDDPSIADKPVIVGGGKRGVVATCCYITRTYGVRSAMPMFEALRRCPYATVVRPNIAKYLAVGRQVREAMLKLTPLIEPLSIDEAFLDLTGTERLHGLSAAKVLARLARDVERELGITISIGLSANKFLAKIASDLDKPRGFAVLSPSEASAFLAEKPVGFIYGVGKVTAAKMADHGFRTVADLQRADEHDLMRRYGLEGLRLWRLARGIDDRKVDPERDTKSVSAESTFERDIVDFRPLEQCLWSLSEKVSSRLKAHALAGSTVTLKLKTADFKIRTRARSLGAPTLLAARIFEVGRDLLRHEVGTERYRLLGIGVSNIEEAGHADLVDLLDARTAKAEHAVDELRAKFGRDAVVTGLAVEEE